MLTTFLQRLELGSRRLLPLASTVFFIFLSAISLPLPHFGAVSPSLGLIAVYYWSMHRPDLFRPMASFALGVLYDSLHYLPLGLSAFVFVAVHQLVLSQRRFFVGHAFFMLWSGFALIMIIVMVGHWLVLSALDGRLISFLPIMIQGALTVVIFPLPVWVLIYMQRTLLSQV